VKTKILGVLAALTMLCTFTLASAPPASAANLMGFPGAQLVARKFMFNNNGSVIGAITVWFDGYSIAAYVEKTGILYQEPFRRYMEIYLCFNQWGGGPNVGIDDFGNKQTCGHDSGQYLEYAGPAIPNPSAALHRDNDPNTNNYKPFRASATILWGNTYYSTSIEANGGIGTGVYGFHIRNT
jgi:hypothetical protein